MLSERFSLLILIGKLDDLLLTVLANGENAITIRLVPVPGPKIQKVVVMEKRSWAKARQVHRSEVDILYHCRADLKLGLTPYGKSVIVQVLFSLGDAIDLPPGMVDRIDKVGLAKHFALFSRSKPERTCRHRTTEANIS